ncbi:MAG: hypothetical protein PVJ39_05050 [Gammaproteobacteria bacterium]|jgi:hypothetical protein
MSEDEFADRMRSMVQHENTMRDQRLNWLLASQGLLVTALGFSWGKDTFLTTSIAMVGLVFCVSIGANLYCNTLAIRKLTTTWTDKCSTQYDGPAITALRSNDIRPRIITRLYPWNILPVTLSVFWLALLGYIGWVT